MKYHAILGACIAAVTIAYTLFWLANKAILLNYHPHMADLHWLLRYFDLVAAFDFLAPMACLLAAAKQPTRRGLWLCAAGAILLGAITFQELTLGEVQIQLSQTRE